MKFIARTLYSLVEILYPSICEVCNKKIEEDNSICSNCLNEILEKSNGFTRNLLDTYDIIYVARYDQIKRYMINYKFNNKKYIGKMFSTLFIKRISLLNTKFDYITSVPLSKEKKKLRGYNQSEYIATNVAKYYNKKFIEVLFKNKNNVNQSSLGIEERKENIKGIFDLVDKNLKSILENKTLLLIDDVYTTGATIDECVKVIKSKINCNIIIGIIAMNNNKI